MMNKQLVVSTAALVVCLAGLASGAHFGWKSKEVDYKALGALLVKNVDHNEGHLEDNFAFIEDNLETMTAGARRAAEILQQVKGLRGCNDEALKLLARAVQTGVREMFARGGGKAERRISDIIRFHLERMIDLCVPYVDEQLKAKASTVDDSTRHLVDITRPWYYAYESDFLGRPREYDMEADPASYVYCVTKDYKVAIRQEINRNRMGRYLNDLALLGGEPKDYFIITNTKTDDKKGNEDNFEAAFKKYLVGPCKEFADHFEPLMDGVQAITSLILKYTSTLR